MTNGPAWFRSNLHSLCPAGHAGSGIAAFPACTGLCRLARQTHPPAARRRLSDGLTRHPSGGCDPAGSAGFQFGFSVSAPGLDNPELPGAAATAGRHPGRESDTRHPISANHDCRLDLRPLYEPPEACLMGVVKIYRCGVQFGQCTLSKLNTTIHFYALVCDDNLQPTTCR